MILRFIIFLGLFFTDATLRASDEGQTKNEFQPDWMNLFTSAAHYRQDFSNIASGSKERASPRVKERVEKATFKNNFDDWAAASLEKIALKSAENATTESEIPDPLLDTDATVSDESDQIRLKVSFENDGEIIFSPNPLVFEKPGDEVSVDLEGIASDAMRFYVRNKAALRWQQDEQTLQSLKTGKSEVVLVYNDDVHFLTTTTGSINDETAEAEGLEIAEPTLADDVAGYSEYRPLRLQILSSTEVPLPMIRVSIAGLGEGYTDAQGFIVFENVPVESRFFVFAEDATGTFEKIAMELYVDPRHDASKEMIKTIRLPLNGWVDHLVGVGMYDRTPAKNASLCAITRATENGTRLDGVRLSVDIEGVRPVYINDLGLADPQLFATSPTGEACFSGLPEGPVTVSLHEASSGALIKSFVTSVIAQRLALVEILTDEESYIDLDTVIRAPVHIEDAASKLSLKVKSPLYGEFNLLGSDESLTSQEAQPSRFNLLNRGSDRSSPLPSHLGRSLLYFNSSAQGSGIKPVLYQVRGRDDINLNDESPTNVVPLFYANYFDPWTSDERSGSIVVEWTSNEVFRVEIESLSDVGRLNTQDAKSTFNGDGIAYFSDLPLGCYQVKVYDTNDNLVVLDTVHVYESTPSYLSLKYQ